MTTSIGALIRRDMPPGAEVKHARAIQSGFDELWVIEDLPFAGGISQQAAVLATTDSVAVGLGIAPAPFRNPASLAMEWATLAEMFPGRVIGGIGHGVQAWMEQIGERVGSPLTLLKETMLAIRRLLAGELVNVDGRYVQLDGVQLEYPPSQAPKVLSGVTGPKSLMLSGAVADGTVLSEGYGPADIERAQNLIDMGREEAGRSDHHHLTVFAGFFVGNLEELGEPNPDADSTFSWAAIGEDSEGVAAQLQTLIDAGADSVVLLPFGRHVTQQLQLAAAEIVPNLMRR